MFIHIATTTRERKKNNSKNNTSKRKHSDNCNTIPVFNILHLITVMCVYLLMLWLSFFCLSLTSAIESSSGSCFIRILSSANSFSSFNASSNDPESRFRISSMKSFAWFNVIFFQSFFLSFYIYVFLLMLWRKVGKCK